MKKYILLYLLLISGFALSQVGVNTTNPNSSALLDLNSNNKGLYIPQYNLTTLTSKITPINDPATGLLIYNTGNTYPEGLYYWTGSLWERFHTLGDFNEVLALNKTTGNIFGATTTPTTISNYSTIGNTIQGASISSTGDITLPAGKYRVYIKLDGSTNTTSSEGYFTSAVNGSTVHTHNIAVRAVITNGSNTEITKPQVYSIITDGTILGYEYNFWINITGSTNTVRLRMNYDNATSTGGISAAMRSHQSGLKITIIKMQ